MRRFLDRLPAPVRMIALAVVVVAALILLFFLFEFAGDLLDSGGVVG